MKGLLTMQAMMPQEIISLLILRWKLVRVRHTSIPTSCMSCSSGMVSTSSSSSCPLCLSRLVQKTLFQTHTSGGISETKGGTRPILTSASLKPTRTAARKRREGIFFLAKCANLWKVHFTTTNESTYFLQTWPYSHQARC